MNRRTRSNTSRSRQPSSPTPVHIPSSPEPEPNSPPPQSPQAGTSSSRPRPKTAGRGGSHSTHPSSRVPKPAMEDMATDNLPDLVFQTENLRPLDRFEHLKNKRFENTRVFTRVALETLGVASDFYRLAGSIGISPEFFHIYEPAYTRLTMEFLCSIDVAVDQDEYFMTCQLMGTTYRVSADQLARIFYLQPGGLPVPTYDDTFFQHIIGGRDDPRNRRTNQIQHPALRFLQRAFSFSLFARGESGTRPLQEEISLLASILKPQQFPRPNLAILMMRHWETVANSTKTGKSQITIGGFVTHLARNLGVSGFHRMTPSGGPSSIDLDRIQQANFVKKDGDTYYWIIGLNRLPMPLNRPPLDIHKKSTFIFYRVRDDDQGGAASGEGGDPMEEETEPQAEEGAHMPPMRDGAGIGEGSERAGGEEADVGRERRRRRRGDGSSAAGSATPDDPYGGRPQVDLREIYDMMTCMQITTMQMSDRQRAMEARQIAMQEQQMAIQAQQEQMSQRLGSMYTWWEQQHGGGGGGSSDDPPSDPGFYF